MKVWVTALMPTKGADCYEGVRTGAALSERDAYLELLDFFDGDKDVSLDKTATNEQITELLDSHPEVEFWKIEAQEVSFVSPHKSSPFRRAAEAVIGQLFDREASPDYFTREKIAEIAGIMKAEMAVGEIVERHSRDDLRKKISERLTAGNASKELEGSMAEDIVRMCLDSEVEDESVTVRVRWGSVAARHDNPELNIPDVYSFKTQAEADAFLHGMDEADGWTDWAVNPGEDDDEEDDDVLKTYEADWLIKSTDDGTVIASGQMRMAAASVEEAVKNIREQVGETRPEADLDDISVVVETPHVVDEDDEDDEDLDTCTTPGCGNSTADGEGWDGKCGSCADKDFEKSPEGKELLADGDGQPAS